jgi:hypothetical protein
MLCSPALSTPLISTAADHNTVTNKYCASENQSATDYVGIIFVEWRFQKVGRFIIPNTAINPSVCLHSLRIKANEQSRSWRASSSLLAQEIPRHSYYPNVNYRAATTTKPKFYTKLRNVLILIYDLDRWILSHTPNWKVVHRWPPMTAHSATLGLAMLWSHGAQFIWFCRFNTPPLPCFLLFIAFLYSLPSPVFVSAIY